MADIIEEEVSQEDSWSPFAGLPKYEEGMKTSEEAEDAPIPPQVKAQGEEAPAQPKEEAKKEPEEEKEEVKEDDLFKDAAKDEEAEGEAPQRGRKPMTAEDYEAKQINALYDVFVEDYGWGDIKPEERPRNAKEFVEFVTALIAENSVPQYASPELQQMDNFVRQGGNLQSYIRSYAETNYDGLDISNEQNQKYAVAEMLKLQGYPPEHIRKKVENYAKSGVLADEAQDAMAILKGYSQNTRQAQMQQQQQAIQQEQQMTNQMIQTTAQVLGNMNDVCGIPISFKEKKELFEYMFKLDNRGISQFMAEYSSSPESIIAAAYLTKHGQDALRSAEAQGQKKAIDKFRDQIVQQQTRSKGAARGGSAKNEKGSERKLWDIMKL